MENSIYENLIGNGVLFPIVLTQNDKGETGWYPVKGDPKLIENNLESIFIHQLGVKLREEDFGSRVWECIEEPNTQAQAFLINQFLKEAFNAWEDRITFVNSIIQREGSKLNIEFIYKLNNSNSSRVGNITYDYNNNTLNTY